MEKVLVHERDEKGVRESPQTIEIYFNFIRQFTVPNSAVPLTAEQQAIDPELQAQREVLRQKRREAYQKRKKAARIKPTIKKSKVKTSMLWMQGKRKSVPKTERMGYTIFQSRLRTATELCESK